MPPPLPEAYLQWFELFEREEFFDAHEVLELLWQEGGRGHPNFGFFKGLIQVAGVFRHFQLQHAHPEHPVHGARLRPALRLLRSARENLEGYPSPHLGLDVEAARDFCRRYQGLLEEAPRENPWRPGQDPGFPRPAGG